MNRRGFLQSILAAGVAPYVMSGGIASGIIMPVRKLWVPSSAMLSQFLDCGNLNLYTGAMPSDLYSEQVGELIAQIQFDTERFLRRKLSTQPS